MFLVPGPAEGARLSGAVLCDDCEGGVGVAVHGEEGADGLPLAVIGLLKPGPFEVSVPDDATVLYLFAFRDADTNGVPDPGADLVAHAGNPVEIGATNVAGIDLALSPLAPGSVFLGGTVTCASCNGPIGIRIAAEDGGTVALLGREAPGPWRIGVGAGEDAVP